MASYAIPTNGNVPLHIEINEFEPEKTKDQEKQAQDDLAYVDDEKGNHDLPEDLKKELQSLLKHYGLEVDKLARRYEVVDARRQRFYDRGYQYIYFNWGSYVFLPITAGQVMNVGSDSVQMPRYCNVYNIYKPYRRNFSATLAQNPPGVNFEPKDPTSSLDIKVAECAEKYSEHYDQVNDTKKLQTKMARLFWTDGRVVAWTRHVKNAEKFGTYQDKQDEQDYQEDQSHSQEAASIGQADQLAAVLGEDAGDEGEKGPADPRGEEITKLYGVLEAKVFPITADEQDDLTGAIISDDPDLDIAKDHYSWISEHIKAGTTGKGETAFERNSRLGVMQGLRIWAQSADSYAHLTERQHLFLRPGAFGRCQNDLGDRLKKLFPKGVRATFVSGTYAESWNTSFDDELKVDHALDGDGMNRPSWGRDHMPVQDATNNYRNMRQEYHDYGIPFTMYDLQLMDGQALRERVSQPGEFMGVTNPAPGQNLQNFIWQSQPAQVPTDMIEAEQELRDAWSQLITGVQPALFGGNLGAGKDDRVGVYQMAREQAMGVMGLPWGVMQGMFACFKYQAVLAAARNRRAEDKVTFMKKRRGGRSRKPVSISIGDLQKGNFRAVPDTDSSFPATRQMKKQAYTEFFGASQDHPMIQEASMQPDNLELGAQLEGLPELVIPAADAWERQQDEIDQLLDAGAIPPKYQQLEALDAMNKLAAAAKASAAGQVASNLPPQQAIPTPDEYMALIKSGQWPSNPIMASLAKCSVDVKKQDFHNYHRMAIKNWFNSKDYDKEADRGNLTGILNVDLHDQQHEKFMEQEAAKQQPPSKPPAESINFKDVPVPEKIQMLAKVGIQASPADFAVMPPPAAAAPPAAGAQPGAAG